MMVVAHTSTMRNLMGRNKGDFGLSPAEVVAARIEIALLAAVSLEVATIRIQSRMRDERGWVDDRQPTREQTCPQCGHTFTARRYVNGMWPVCCSRQCSGLRGSNVLWGSQVEGSNETTD